ncbi:hypothetical protein MHK_010411 [Candidatus Magnetomorum sp. HK-1]|nr:hypothetical protein MHK_010411 [Candidatus Magnetomorum sp. HK-1]
MKKIKKTPGPNHLTNYEKKYPVANWSDFKNYNGGEGYQCIRNQILKDQGGLCAYCETKIIDLPPHKQRVEHFHAKSDKAFKNKNWALDWNNIFGVCIGGDDSDKKLHPLPENLSCDSHKNHLFNKKQLPEACEKFLVNPLKMIATPCLFDFHKATGELRPNINTQKHESKKNDYEISEELLKKSIDILNLNCDRLKQQRLLILKKYNQMIAKARKRNDKECFSKISALWFKDKWQSFFTTRRLLLGKHAEVFLSKIGYDG